MGVITFLQRIINTGIDYDKDFIKARYRAVSEFDMALAKLNGRAALLRRLAERQLGPTSQI